MKMKLMGGRNFVQAILDKQYNLYPNWQRHEKPNKKLATSLEESAREGLLAFVVHERLGQVADAAQRSAVLLDWSNDASKVYLLDSVEVAVANYDHMEFSDFVEFYFRLASSKSHTAGDFIRGHFNKLDKAIRDFANHNVFKIDGSFADFAVRNAHWETLVCVAYKLSFSARRGDVVARLEKNHADMTATQTIDLAKRSYSTLVAIQKNGAKSTTAKWAVALMFRLIEKNNVDKVPAEIVARAWEQYRLHAHDQQWSNREVEPSTDRLSTFNRFLNSQKSLAKFAKAAAGTTAVGTMVEAAVAA
jgi:hypothetical protein